MEKFEIGEIVSVMHPDGTSYAARVLSRFETTEEQARRANAQADYYGVPFEGGPIVARVISYDLRGADGVVWEAHASRVSSPSTC